MALSPTSSRGGGGVLTNKETFASAPVSIAAGAAHELTWTKLAGDTLLDLTDPTLPLVLASGVYATSVGVYFDPPTAVGKSALGQLIYDFADEAYSVEASGPLSLTETLKLQVTLVGNLSAGMGMLVDATHDDTAAILVRLFATVARLS